MPSQRSGLAVSVEAISTTGNVSNETDIELVDASGGEVTRTLPALESYPDANSVALVP